MVNPVLIVYYFYLMSLSFYLLVRDSFDEWQQLWWLNVSLIFKKKLSLNCISGFTAALQSRSVHASVHDGLQLAGHELPQLETRQIPTSVAANVDFEARRGSNPKNTEVGANFHRIGNSGLPPSPGICESDELVRVGDRRSGAGHFEHEQLPPLKFSFGGGSSR